MSLSLTLEQSVSGVSWTIDPPSWLFLPLLVSCCLRPLSHVSCLPCLLSALCPSISCENLPLHALPHTHLAPTAESRMCDALFVSVFFCWDDWRTFHSCLSVSSTPLSTWLGCFDSFSTSKKKLDEGSSQVITHTSLCFFISMNMRSCLPAISQSSSPTSCPRCTHTLTFVCHLSC